MLRRTFAICTFYEYCHVKMVLASASQLSYNRAEMRISKMIFTFYLVQASHIKQTESEILRIKNI